MQISSKSKLTKLTNYKFRLELKILQENNIEQFSKFLNNKVKFHLHK